MDNASTDTRERAWQVVRQTSLPSVKLAFAFTGGVAGVAGVLGSAIVALNAFSPQWLVALGTMTLATWPVALMTLEFVRLRACHAALKEVLSTEKVYEALLSDVRRERDELQAQLQRAQLDVEIARAASSLLGVVNAAQAAALAPPPTKDDANG